MKKTSILILILLLVIGLTSGCGFLKGTINSYEEDKTTIEEPSQSEDIQIVYTKEADSKSTICDDSVDDGNNPYVKGITTVGYEGETTKLTDKCNDDYVLEYYCDGNVYKSYQKLCQYGCNDGACRQSSEPVKDVSVVTEQVSHESDRVDEVKTSSKTQPHCTNGYKDGDETDLDCGGSCKTCGYGKMCKSTADCQSPYFCNYRSKMCLETKS